MPKRACSFCGKRENEVAHLVVGRSAAICDECIDVCADVNRAGVTHSDSVLLTGIGELVTNDRYQPTLLGRVVDAAVAIDDGVVRWAGPHRDLPAKYSVLPTLECGGRAVIPGFVDASSRVVFGGERSDEYVAARTEGYTTLDRAQTAKATAATALDRLREESVARMVRMLRHGTTTADIRVGHGLSPAATARSLDIAAELAQVGPAVVPTTCIAGHSADVDLILTELLAVCGPRSSTAAIDMSDFDDHSVEAIAKEASRLGLAVRLTGEPISAQIVRTVQPLSVDNPPAVLAEALNAAHSAAILIPAATYGGERIDGRALWDADVVVAIAPGGDPDTLYVDNPQLAVAMATAECGLTADEALWAATRGGAIAIDDERRGWVGRGAVGDVVVLDAPTASHLAYHAGSNLAWKVFKAGRQVATT